MKNVLKEEEYNYYKKSLAENYSLTNFDQAIIIKMFDYQTVE